MPYTYGLVIVWVVSIPACQPSRRRLLTEYCAVVKDTKRIVGGVLVLVLTMVDRGILKYPELSPG